MRYKVIAEHTVSYAIFVEARNEEDARNKVLLNEFDGESATLVEEGERTIISLEAEKKPLLINNKVAFKQDKSNI